MHPPPFRILCTEDDADTRELITFVLTGSNFEVITTETPAVALEIAQAKWYANVVAQEVANEAIQIHGGYGYTREFPVERMFRDVRGLAIGAGTVEVQKNLIARLLDRQGENEAL